MPITRSRKPPGMASRATRRLPRRGPGKSGKSGKSSNTWLWWAGGIGVSLIISLVVKFSNKSSDDTHVREEMFQVVRTFPDYANHAKYYTELVDRYHHEAFEAAYSMGGRRQSAKLDSEAYLTQISQRMASKAAADGNSSVATTLSAFNQALRAP